MRVNLGNGNVGIGTTSPNAKLHVQGDGTQYSGALIISDSATTGGVLAFGNTSHGIGRGLGDYSSNELIFYNAVADDMHFAFTPGPGYGYPDVADSKVTFKTNGNVGIGTTNPSAKLQVDSTSIGLILRDSDSATSLSASPYVQFENSTGTRIGYIGDGSSGADGMFLSADTGYVRLSTVTAQPIQFHTNSTEKMRIADGGNVGIGVTNPKSDLQVGTGVNLFTAGVDNLHFGRNIYHDGSYKRSIADNDVSFMFMDSSGDTTFYSNSDANTAVDSTITLQSNMIIKKSGSVGIGTLTPDSLLTLNNTGNDITGINTAGEGSLVIEDSTSDTTGWKLRIDSNELQVSNDNAVGSFNINPFGGEVKIQGSNVVLNQGGGNTAVGPDIQFSASGLISSEDNILINIDSDNDDTNSYFSIRHNGNTAPSSTELFRVDNSGNVGIGTTSPTEKLHVNGDIYVQGQDLWFSYDDLTNANNDYIAFSDTAALGSTGVFIFKSDTVRDKDITTPTAAISAKGGHFLGNVGIGTVAPATKLHVNGGVCVTSDDACGSVPASGEISAETTLNTGADYAEYFLSEDDSLRKGDLVGLNEISGKVRAFKSGDHLIGIVSTNPGVIGNSKLRDEEDTVLVALVGQVPFNHGQVQVINGFAYSLDNTPLGMVLDSGHVYINISSVDGHQNREIASLKEENTKMKKELNDLKQIVCSIKPNADICQ
jgi:hypothetical protein